MADQLQKPATIIDESGFSRLQKLAEQPSLYQTAGMYSPLIIFENDEKNSNLHFDRTLCSTDHRV